MPAAAPAVTTIWIEVPGVGLVPFQPAVGWAQGGMPTQQGTPAPVALATQPDAPAVAQQHGAPQTAAAVQVTGGVPALPASNATLAPSQSPLKGIARVEVISTHKLGIRLPTFNQEFVDAIKSLPYATTERRWKPTEKYWEVNGDAYQMVKERLAECGFGIEPLLSAELAALMAQQDRTQAPLAVGGGGDPAAQPGAFQLVPMTPEAEVEAALATHIPPQLWQRLRPFQQEGVKFGLRRGGRVLLADEMGLGKTVQAITLAACYPQDWPLLVLCPTSLRLVWAEMLEAWLPPALAPAEGDLWVITSGDDLRGRLAQGRPPRGRPHALILPYSLAKCLEGREGAAYGVVIADESHKLKNRGAQRTEACATFVRQARRALLLTGTPLLNRPIEVWAQVDVLRPALLGSYHDFGAKYCTDRGQAATQGCFPWQEYRGARNTGELHAVLSNAVMLRRTKEQVMRDLPAKLRKKVAVPVTAGAEASLAAIRAALRDSSQGGGQGDDILRQHLQMAFYRASGPAKVEGVVAFISENLLCEENKQKLLIFAHHRGVMDAIEERVLRAGNHKFIRIDGSTDPAARKALVDRFQDPAQGVQAALLSITAAGEGLTLTAAQAVVFAELHWTPQAMFQAEDRVHRIGLKQSVVVYYCTAKGTVDDLQWPLLNKKAQVVTGAVEGSLQGAAAGMHASDWEADMVRLAAQTGAGGAGDGAAAADVAAAAGDEGGGGRSQRANNGANDGGEAGEGRRRRQHAVSPGRRVRRRSVGADDGDAGGVEVLEVDSDP